MSASATARLRCCFSTYSARKLCSRARRRLTNAEVSVKRNEIFEREKTRQIALAPHVEKIQVQYKGTPDDCTLLMNKGLSTPFNCAMHIEELLMKQSVLAVVNEEPWDMHRPLTADSTLRFLHFRDDNPACVNETFWRSCSFLLGYVLENAFKDEHYAELCSFPPPNVKSGSFVYDADIGIADWQPTTAELSCLSRIAGRLQHQDLRFERLDIDAGIALTMFEDNRFKAAQIPVMAEASQSGSNVTVYRLGSHVDITKGPLIASTHLLGRYNVTAMYTIQSPDYGSLTRVQGIAVPKQLPIHYWTYEFLSERAAKKNPAPVPTLRKPATLMESSSHA